MKKNDGKKPVSAEMIARGADQRRDVSPYFTNSGRMRPPAPTVEAKIERDLKAGAMDERIGQAMADRATGDTRPL